mgnify:FL=1
MMMGGGAGAEAQAKPALDTTTVHCLTPTLLDKTKCYCLNENPNSAHENLFIGDDLLPLKSDADEQLLIHLVFNEFVRVRSLKFLGHRNGTDEETNPTLVKVFVNRVDMGFSDAADAIPADEFELSEEDLADGGGEGKKVSFVKYQRVQSLTIFIEENAGADTTTLGGLKIFGMSVQVRQEH